MKKRTLSLLMTLSLVLSLFVPLVPVTAWAADSGTVGTAEDVPEGYEPPQYERGAINLNGYYTVGSDGKLSQKLEWSFPFENPMQPGQDLVDPSRPYAYQLWQSKKAADGSWSKWETRSAVDVEDTATKVRVLNLYPGSGNNLKQWMETDTAENPLTHKDVSIGMGLISVTPVDLTSFNSNPNSYLKGADGAYQYDVLMFGSYDSNNSIDLSATGTAAVKEFLAAGRGALFGHDTIRSNNVGFAQFAGAEYLNFSTLNAGWSMATTGGNYVKVVNTGFLTSRPWDLEGKTLQIPLAHALGQQSGGTDAEGNLRNQVWMKFSSAAGAPLDGIVDHETSTNVAYLTTHGNTAMIQTGHSNGQATTDEKKILANTLIYLAQTTQKNETTDISFTDDAAPDKPQGEVTAITPNAGLTGYSARVMLSGSSDNGTDYAYRVLGIPQKEPNSELDKQEYTTIWSSGEAIDQAFHQTALSGLKGYIVTGVDQSGAAAAKPTVAGSDLLRASNAGDKVTYDTGELVPGKTYYMHAFAVDWSGNVSEDLLLKIDVSARQVNFYRNDGSDEKTSTLLTSEGRPAGFTDSLARAGYAFGGWYESADGSGEVVTRETVFPLMPEKEAVELYAKWIKTWQVTLGQRGEGTVTAQTAAGQSSPFLVGSDVAVQWQPAPGYHVKGVWLDDRQLTPDDSGQLTIAAIDADHHVLVEFERDAAAEEKVYYRVETMLIGGGSASSITPSARLAKDSPQTENYRVSWKVAPGYFVKAVRIDGASRPDLQAKSSVTFDKVASDHRVEIELAKENEAPSAYRVTTELVGGPGSITPSAWVPAGRTYAVKTVLGDSKNYTVRSVTVYDAQGDRVDSFAVDAAAGSVDLTDIGQDYRVVVQLSGKEQTGVVTIPEDELIRVNTSKEGGGSISESKVVKKGEDYTVEWSAQEGWTVLDVTVDDTRTYYPETGTARRAAYRSARSSGSIVIGTPGEYPFEQIQEDHTIHVTFVKAKYEAPAGTFSVQTAITGDCGATITAGNGALDPGSDYPVGWTVPKGYRVVGVLVNGTARDDLLKAGSFTITNIDQNYLVEVALEKDNGAKPEKKEIYTVSTAVYGLTDAAMANMTPTTIVQKGADHSVRWTAPSGHRVEKVVIDGVESAATAANFPNIGRDHTVEVYFAADSGAQPDLHRVSTQIVGGLGTVTAGGTVADGDSFTVRWEPAPGYHLASVIVDGQVRDDLLGADSHTLENITADHTVGVVFAKDGDSQGPKHPEDGSFVVETAQTGAGSITPSTTVKEGDDHTVTWQPADGWHVKEVRVDGLIQPDLPDKTEFLTIGTDHKVEVIFARDDAGSEPESGEKYRVDTAIDRVKGTITGSAVLERGSDYKVQWQAVEGYEVYRVTVDGKEYPDHRGKTAGSHAFADIKQDHQVVVEFVRVDTVQPELGKGVVNGDRSDGNETGDRLTYTLTAKNNQQNSLWKDVVMKDRIPRGMTLDTDTIYLSKNGEEAVQIDDSCYDESSRLLCVPIGSLLGGDTYVLTFEVLINQVSIEPGATEGRDLSNTAQAAGSNGSATSPTVTPNGDGSAKPIAYPNGHLTKTAADLTDSGGKVQIGDRIRYVLRAENSRDGSVWTGVTITDTLPQGLDIDLDSIYLTGPDGSRKMLDGGAYNTDDRTLTVFVGDIYGGERYELTFEVTVTADALTGDIGNTGKAYGGRPAADGEPGHWGDAEEYPYEPGDTLRPGEWPIEADELAASDKVYPGDEQVLPADPEPILDKTVEQPGRPDGDTHLDDALIYTVTLENPTSYSTWRDVSIFDYLPAGLDLDRGSMRLTYPDGHTEKVPADCYDIWERTIEVQIPLLRAGEKYTLTYKTTVYDPGDAEMQEQGELVNTAEAVGTDPDGQRSDTGPTASASVRYPVDAQKGVDTGDAGWQAAILWAAVAAGAVFFWIAARRKEREN
ncbi:fimbrial isopeptide formation D2 domain [Anaerotruncus sp. 2789STDY5834896]|uniref:Fimbrial isopeptide formation D2 domain n=1 Tax=uncultured Anaerotruncus sp. TaxID=905011 RepID=A0A1C6G575_9FIRM|nr:fimbrial isopeptide formation D2 domain [uncultured Anaerotruncus sp.]